MGLGLAMSGNGLDWTRHPANPIIPEWAADCQVLTYDSDRREVRALGTLRRLRR